MKLLLLLLAAIHASLAYSKYGRTCKDIGCLSSEVCIMETDPCSYYQRQNECGSYPTCKKSGTNEAPSCKNYVCPPTKVCRMDAATPKCVDDHSKVNQVGYDTSALNTDQGGVYPKLPVRGETTPRPNVNYQPGQGYQGGQVGSGYPGGQVGSGYPGQARPGGNYPQQPYPGYNGYQQGGYSNNQQGGYPGGYNQNGQQYPNNYYQGQQQGYNPYGQQGGYGGQKSGAAAAGGGIVDSLTSALKSYGTNLLKDAIAKKLSGQH